MNEWTEYMIARRNHKARSVSALGSSDNLTFDLHAPQPMSPRSAQALFEWEMQTKKHDARKVLELERDKTMLTLQLIELENELDQLTKTGYLMHAFRGWVQFVAWDSHRE